jgi:hypothetical protein
LNAGKEGTVKIRLYLHASALDWCAESNTDDVVARSREESCTGRKIPCPTIILVEALIKGHRGSAPSRFWKGGG